MTKLFLLEFPITKIFRHRRLGKWNGIDYQPKYKSTGGCSTLGVDSEGTFGLVYKATESSGGVYRYATDESGYDYHDYMYPLHFNEIP